MDQRDKRFKYTENIWNNFDPYKGNRQPLPPPGRLVLVEIAPTDTLPACAVVGYLKFFGGDAQSPNFVHPGAGSFGRLVTRWNDCLGDAFLVPPGWEVSATLKTNWNFQNNDTLEYALISDYLKLAEVRSAKGE